MAIQFVAGARVELASAGHYPAVVTAAPPRMRYHNKGGDSAHNIQIYPALFGKNLIGWFKLDSVA